MIILCKDLTGQREKLFLKPIDIIKDFTRDYDTAAKILLKKITAQFFHLSCFHQFPCPVNSSCKRSIYNPEGEEQTQTALAWTLPKLRCSDFSNLSGLVLFPSVPETRGKER